MPVIPQSVRDSLVARMGAGATTIAGSRSAAIAVAKATADTEAARSAPAPTCVACGGTGKASNGAPCVPCVMNGRVK